MPLIHGVAIVGKYNEPLFLLTPQSEGSKSLNLQYIMHSSLDIIEEKRLKR